MSIKFEVESLGKITTGNFRVSNLTVVTGPNGTGKSFFTKFLYSIFATVENFTVWGETRKTLLSALDRLNSINKNYNNLKSEVYLLESEIKKLLENSFNPHDVPRYYIEETSALKSINDKIIALDSMFKIEFSDYLKLSDEELRNKHLQIWGFKFTLELLKIFVTNSTTSYEYFIETSLGIELKSNFQIEKLDELISHGKDELHFNFNDVIDITISRSEESIEVKLNPNAIDFFRNRPNSIFFESPAYWRVRDALIDAKLNTKDDYLTGIPKYFFDLDKALRMKSISNDGLEDIFEDIRSKLGGEFEIDGNDIIFKELSGVTISKNLVSFGMTNLGMLNALIKNNVICSESYVFIDEPETNLHPDWQLLMIESLIKLSIRGVKVIINTHSIEILKHIENYFRNMSNEHLSVNYLDIDGEVFEFESEIPWKQTSEAREMLSSTYFDLYMNGISD